MDIQDTLSRTMPDAAILIVDDEPANVDVLVRLLERAGYSDVVGLTDPREVEGRFVECEPDLLVLDLWMPHLDGFDVMHRLRPAIRQEEFLPILVLSGDDDTDVRARALSGGAHDFLTKPFDALDVLLRIRNHLETRRLHLELRDHNRKLEKRVLERTRALYEAQTEILFRLALAAEYRDDVTGQHAQRVGILSEMIGREMAMSEKDVNLLRRAAPLHDVGKIGVPDRILLKPDSLTVDEKDVVRSHVDIGSRLLSGGSFDLLRVAEVIALTHHERWDGGGYKGMKGTEIPLVGRIVAVADVYDVITSDRPYKTALAPEEAVQRIRDDAGAHFDPDVVDAFLRVVESTGLPPATPS